MLAGARRLDRRALPGPLGAMGLLSGHWLKATSLVALSRKRRRADGRYIG